MAEVIVKELIRKLSDLRAESISVDELSGLIGVREECVSQECDYFSHYLAWYDPAVNGRRLDHFEYHAASLKCQEAQDAISRWMDEHDGDPLNDATGRALWERATRWERKVAA